MQQKTRNRILVIFAAGFLFLDQWLKHLASFLTHPIFLWRPWIGIEYFLNRGIAFSIPLPNSAVLFLTILAGIFFGYGYLKKKSFIRQRLPGWLFLVFGALSNFADRVRFFATTDYIRVWTGVFNLADIMIAFGVILLLLP